ncbi:MAG: YkgJ family cysteine cluster protein [Myxococcales bacterium]|jgi:Fe-S-cluster containining protein
MKDSARLALLKLFVRWLVLGELAVRRALRRIRERPYWARLGACCGCGRCCERPSIRVGAFVWFMPRTRRLFLWWQRRVNGFELVSADAETRTFEFRCTHFDPERRVCDSYATRPAMCRDYPGLLFDQAWPELFPECGFRARVRNADALAAGIDATELSDEQKAELKRKLRLD